MISGVEVEVGESRAPVGCVRVGVHLFEPTRPRALRLGRLVPQAGERALGGVDPELEPAGVHVVGQIPHPRREQRGVDGRPCEGLDERSAGFMNRIDY